MSSEQIPHFSAPSQLVFHDETLRFNCHQPPPQRQVADTGFIEDRYFATPQGAELRRPSDAPEQRGQSRSDLDDDDDDDGDDDEEEEDEVADGNCSNVNNSNSVGGSVSLCSGNDGNLNQQPQNFSAFGPSREVMMKDGNGGQSLSIAWGGDVSEGGHDRRQLDGGYNSVTIADHDASLYYSQYVQGGAEGPASAQKNVGAESYGGVSGRKDSASCSSESGESLRSILSDPITGTLMEDAMILPCGHSYGSGGIQHIIKMKACKTCTKSVSEDQISPNLSLRVAVQAFRREEESHIHRSSKRRRDRFEQDKASFGDRSSRDPLRARRDQFPFAVTDRVIIKGNKRTPQRFVGREAVVTTQCLNGWYVVKTLDNAESVKLQYRSLAKVPDERSILKDNVKQRGSHLALDF